MGRQALLPVIISVPHGGTEIPAELRTFCSLRAEDILLDGDTYARELYAIADQVACYVDTEVARAVIDMNRAPDDRPPENSDGVVKTYTVQFKQVWTNPEGLPEQLIEQTIERYHRPYHQALAKASRSNQVDFGLDCHTMLAVAPKSKPGELGPGEEAGKKKVRPLICLSNRGDMAGLETGAEPLTAPTELIDAFCHTLMAEFQHQDVEVVAGLPLITFNDPFRGGYIVKSQGALKAVPWIQLELSKALYLTEQTVISPVPDVATLKRLHFLRDKIQLSLIKLF